MTATVKGRIDWSLDRDKDGHREYRLRNHVVTTDPEDGPERVYFAAGAPAIGVAWTYGNDNDPWAMCWPTARVTPIVTREPNKHWILENFFSTKPLSRCQDDQIESPLLEPDRISGSFVKYNREARWDRFGNLILSSSHEPIRGIERDVNRPTVTIEQNESLLGLPTLASMIDTVNDATLWGLPSGCIKLSCASWERRLYGTCTFYYVRHMEFDIRYDGFDVYDVADAGFKVFDGGLLSPIIPPLLPHLGRFEDTPTNRANPLCYMVHKDGRGSNQPTKVLLDGLGSALLDPTSPVFLPPIQLYDRSNFLLLGVPTSL